MPSICLSLASCWINIQNIRGIRTKVSFFKKLIIAFGLAFLTLHQPVLAQAVSSDKLTYRSGVAYSKIDNEPYDGDVLNFHSNGQLDFKGGYKNGRKDGIWVGYYFDGQLKYRGRYKNGKRNGRWDTKTKFGQTKKWHSGIFKNDVRVSD
jgi:antitoxin component YwqK of YwqJK toxin-antitoxin module